MSSDVLPLSARERVPVDWRRVRSPRTAVAYVLALVAAVCATLSTVVAGRLAGHPSALLLAMLAALILGANVIDTAGKTIWAAVCDRAEGRLRADLLDAALEQPLSELTEQAVGEILDRVDDDTAAVGRLMRDSVYAVAQTVLSIGPLWLVASLTWWPTIVVYPVTAGLTWLTIRRLLPQVAQLKVIEEARWTDHAAATEEGIAARDDVRASLGQAHVVARSATFAAAIFVAQRAFLRIQSRTVQRSGLMLHSLLAGVGVIGAVLVGSGRMSTSELVTLFMLTTYFTGTVSMLAYNVTDLQEGFGAVLRVRAMLAAPAEPVGGKALPDGPLALEFRDLSFSYATGTFALTQVDLTVPAGHTCALVGRTGSGKSTLASLLSRAVEPPRGSVFVGGVDVLDLDLHALRSSVGVVTQRTEILVGTLADNITLFGPQPRSRVEAAVAELGLSDWVAALPDGLDTELGASGTNLSAGEEQLVAFARLLVRDVRIVVLDEATARMDSVTEQRVVRAAERLLAGRTGVLVAHRLSTTDRAEQVAVMESGRVVQQGARAALARTPGPFRRLLDAAAYDIVGPSEVETEAAGIGTARRTTTPPSPPALPQAPGLARTVLRTLLVQPRWGLTGLGLFLVFSLTGGFGALTGWTWGQVIATLQAGERPTAWAIALVCSLLLGPLALAAGIRLEALWSSAVQLRVRLAAVRGQTEQRRLPRDPPGEVVARTLDADRLTAYANRWTDLIVGIVIVGIVGTLARSWVAAVILLAVLVAAAVASSLGRAIAGRSAAAASTARAGFGRALVSALESVRTVKLADATSDIHRHLHTVDGGRVRAAVREHRVATLLNMVPGVAGQLGIISAWGGLLVGLWDVATAILVASAVSGFTWIGKVAGQVVTEAPGTRAWLEATSRFAGGAPLTELPPGVDLTTGAAPLATPGPREQLHTLSLCAVSAIHDDGTIGAEGIDLDVRHGELVLLLGQVGSGKSSLLGALAGLVHSTGEIRWNGQLVDDPQVTLRPGRVAHVAQVPRVLSGTFADNIRLRHPDRDVERPLALARMDRDVAEAGGPDVLVGHRGVRLSGGQVQRLALARAVACEPELLLADDVSSALDAATEIELWTGLRDSGMTVIGATGKAAALARADRVVVLVAGRIAAVGPWSALEGAWSHLAG